MRIPSSKTTVSESQSDKNVLSETASAPLPTVPPAEEQKGIIPPKTSPESPQNEAVVVKKSPRFSLQHQFRLGLRAGAGFSRLTGLGNIAESYDTRPMFTQKERGGLVPHVGIFGTWQYGRLGAELSLDYTRLLSKISLHNHAESVTETTRFQDDYLASQLLLRFYVFPKFYAAAGLGVAIPLGSNHIEYSTSRTGPVYAQQSVRTQSHLRETLQSRPALFPTLKIGYLHPQLGLEMGLEYSFGINDLLKTRPNDYGYQERTNNAHTVRFTVGYSLPLHKSTATP